MVDIVLVVEELASELVAVAAVASLEEEVEERLLVEPGSLVVLVVQIQLTEQVDLLCLNVVSLPMRDQVVETPPSSSQTLMVSFARRIAE